MNSDANLIELARGRGVPPYTGFSTRVEIGFDGDSVGMHGLGADLLVNYRHEPLTCCAWHSRRLRWFAVTRSCH